MRDNHLQRHPSLSLIGIAEDEIQEVELRESLYFILGLSSGNVMLTIKPGDKHVDKLLYRLTK